MVVARYCTVICVHAEVVLSVLYYLVFEFAGIEVTMWLTCHNGSSISCLCKNTWKKLLYVAYDSSHVTDSGDCVS